MNAQSVLRDLLDIDKNQAPAYKDDPQYAQDFVPIKDIYEGVIITNDNRYVKILEVLPTNFTLRTEIEQNSIIYNYQKWLNISPMKTQLKIITKRADTSDIIDEVQKRLRYEKDPHVQELGRNYSDYVYSTGSTTAVARRFFLIYEYEAPSRLARLTNKDMIIKELSRTEDSIRSYFATCGNVVLKPHNSDAATAEFLYLYFNKRSYLKETFTQRVLRIEKDIRALNNLSPYDALPWVDIRNLVAPRGVIFEEPGYCIVDGMYRSHIYLDGNKLPMEITGGWLSFIVSQGEGIDVDIFTSRVNSDKMLKRTANLMKFTHGDLSDMSEHQRGFEGTLNKYLGSKYIKEALAHGQETYYLSIFITICAYNYETLMLKKSKLLETLRSRNMPAKTCNDTEKEVFMALAPFLTMPPKIEKRARRNIMTNALACCYPYTAFELYDKGGIFLGTNTINSTLCIQNRFDTKKYLNANMFILGTSGAGKSYTLQLILLRERILGSQVFVISPDKQHEFQRSCKAIGGLFIDVSTSSKQCINIMDIRPEVSPMQEVIDGIDINDKTWLAEKVENLIIWLDLQINKPGISDEEEERLANAIYSCYRKKGITDDNNSLFIDPDDHDKGLKEMPILGDLYEEPDLPPRIKTIMSKFITGRAQIFNGHTTVDLDNQFITFGLERLKGTDMLAPAMFMVLDIILSKAKTDRTKKKIIAIDEGSVLVNGSNIKAAEYVQNLFKVIRGYGGSAIFATQEMSDLFAIENGRYGKAILACSETGLILKLKREEAELVQHSLNLSTQEFMDLQNYSQGQALLCSNSNHIPLYVKASPLEHELITTDRNDLDEMFNKYKKSV